MPSWVEMVGYVASALIVVSLAMASVVRLRVINLIGCLVFVAYGLLIGAWPVVVSNGLIALIDAWFLLRHYRTRSDVGAIPIEADSPYLGEFLAARRADVERFQPGFDLPSPDASAWLLTREGLPVGALVGRRQGDELHIDLDYVTAPYRDSLLGTWLHRDGTLFRDAGIRRLVSDPGTSRHREYLQRMGFHVDGSELVRDL